MALVSMAAFMADLKDSSDKAEYLLCYQFTTLVAILT